MDFFIFCTAEIIIKLFLCLGRDNPTYNLSYMSTFSQQEGRIGQISVFGKHIPTYRLTYSNYW